MTFLKKPSWQIVFAAVLSFCPLSSFSQEKIWEVDLKEALYEVGWILQANDGMIIAAGAKGLLAMDNNTGEIVWHNKELKGIDKNSYLNIDGLPMFYVDYVPMMGKTRGLLINSSNGDVVFDTKDEGYKVKYYSLLPAQECILFELLKDSERLLMKFSLKTWESEWVASLGTPKGLIGKASDQLSVASFIEHGPMFSKDGHLIVGIKSQIYGLDFNTGKTDWDMETDKKIKALVYSDLNNSLYVGVRKSKKLTVLNPDSGEDITPGKLKLKGTLLDIRPDGKGSLILVETEGFNLIDPKTNDLKWKKSYKIEYLDEVIPYKDNYIAIGKDEKNGSISLVDNSGKKTWDGKVKGYAYYATPTSNGVLYVSTERANILNFDNGKDVWDKDVKFKSIPAVTYDDKDEKVVLFENKKGYKFSLKTGKVNLFAEDIELENVNKKTPLVAETVDGGYFIGTDQHVSLLGRDGKLVYSKYFEPVTTIGGLIGVAQVGLAVAGVDFDIQGSMDNMKQLSALAHGAYRGSADQADGTYDESVVAGFYTGSGSGQMTPVFEITKQRHSNSKNAKDHLFVTAKLKNDGAANQNFIYMINKNTGEVDKQIELMDKTPNYLIDEIDDRVFLNEKNHLITGYQM